MTHTRRTANVARNSVVGIATQLVVFACGLGYRTVFIHYLDVKYLGAQSVFGDVLNLLSMAEFGVGSAILFSMYRPMARGDKATVAALLRLYRRLYRIVGTLVLVVGAALTPFLDRLVEPGTELDDFELIYLLLLIDVVFGYWLSYRRTLFVADQQEFQVALSGGAVSIVRYGVQAVVLVTTGSFLLTLVVKIVGTIVTNGFQSWWAARVYPDIIGHAPAPLDPQFLREHFRQIRALMLHKVSGLVLNATDSILIARFFGLGTAGLYSNYLLILGIVTALMQQISSAATAGVGHLTATEPVSHAIRIFELLEFYYQWVYAFATLSLLTLLNPFIALWLGPSFALDMRVVTVVCLNFYLIGRRQVCNTFRNALGLFWHDRYRGPVEALANLLLSLVLLHELGLAGVFLGTAVSMVLLGVWIEPYVLFKHYFHEPLIPYLWGRLVELALVCLLAAPLLWLQQELVDEGFLGFALLAVVCLVGINSVLLLRFRGSWQLSHAMKIRQLAGTKALLPGRLDRGE